MSNKHLKRITATIILWFYSFQVLASGLLPFASAPPTADPQFTTLSASQQSDPTTGSTSQIPQPDPFSSLPHPTSSDPISQSLNLNSRLLGMTGPLSLGVNYDTLIGTTFNGEYVQGLTDYAAISALGEYGSNQYRISGTAGFKVYTDGLIKFTAEHLSQVLPFQFASGNIDQRVLQNAYGFAYQQNLQDSWLKNVSLGGYWAHAPNKQLDNIFFVSGGSAFVNERNLAGATSKGLDVAGQINLSTSTSLIPELNYDDVRYNTIFSSNSPYNKKGIGGSLQVNQLVGDRAMLSANAELRKIYNSYGLELSYVPLFTKELGLEFGLYAQRLVSSNQTPDSTSYGLQVNFLGAAKGKTPYSLGGANANSDVAQWVKAPAVYMQRVLITPEEKVLAITPSSGTIISIYPLAGPIAGGNTIIITGTGFTPSTTVTFGTTPGVVTYISSTELSVVVPALTFRAAAPQSTPVDVTITNPGSEPVTYQYQYVYTNVPVLDSISPTTGPGAGGTDVTITGSNFTGTTAVMFGVVAATSFTVNSDTQISATSPAGTGVVDVTITAPNGTSAVLVEDQFTYIAAPTVTAVNPDAGPLVGGTSVTITGTGFTGATAVTFGATAATSFTVNSDTSITATSPAGSAGSVDVTVTTPGGTSATSDADVFTYDAPPTVTGIDPTMGSTGGTTSVAITGTNFTADSTVKFGTNPGTGVIVNSATSITVTSPAGTGVVDVTVTTPGGTSATSVNDQFTYILSPAVTAVNPNAGPTGGTTSVAITGTNFTDVTAVNFGATPATSYIVNSATSITAVAPAGTGTVDITVVNPVGTSTTSSADHYTYYSLPTVSGINPTAGPEVGAISVTITGTNLSGATAVTFGSTAATSYNVISDTSISAIAPAGTGTVDITVTTPGGTSTTSANDQFTYYPAPTITSINVDAGPAAGGTQVTITGTGFISGSTVNFGTNPGTSVTINSLTSITVTSPAGTGTVDITVTNTGGTSTTSEADQFTYYGLPTVTDVSPDVGPTAGGTSSIIITGTNFTGATAVTFGTNAASTFTVNSDTQITVTSPAGNSAGQVDITVTTPGGTSSIVDADEFTYYDLPTVTNVSPSDGPAAGGTSVTITGTNFTGATGVSFGGTAAASYSVDSDTQITASSPAFAGLTVPTNTVDITVTTPGGTSTTSANDQFTYYPAPTITSIDVDAGPAAGGTQVTITGTGFISGSTVNFGTNPGTSVTINSLTSITVTSPAGSGTVDITVTNTGGTSATSEADQFTYYGIPTITDVSPDVGPTAGGTSSIIITGTNFTGATAVTFGTNAASTFTVNSDTQITVTSPAGNSAGQVDITVTTPGGTSSIVDADEFTYYDPPTVTNVSPSDGPTSGGTSVTITGTNFTGATGVSFGGTAAASYSVDSDTQITASSPAYVGITSEILTVDVTVTTPGGTSATSVNDQFTYYPAPTITSIDVDAGPVAGDTQVTITGTGFISGSTVNFGTNPGTSVTINSLTSITVTSPAGTGTVDITVTNTGGTSTTSEADQFTYYGIPTVTDVSPDVGPTAGGTSSITITGTNFTGATAVTFGTNAASTFTVNSDTSITVTSPAGNSAGQVDITVTTPGGTSSIVDADEFTYYDLPTVTGVSPSEGPTAGGTPVTITGTNFTGATSVSFGSVDAGSFTVVSDTEITLNSPEGDSAGQVDITVTTPGGTSVTSDSDEFTYDDPPTVTSISPDAGTTSGGTPVTITGTNFTADSTVNFGSTPGTSVVVNSSTSITVNSPAGSGTVDITVITAGGTSATSDADQFTYEPAPTVTSISPVAGKTSGGTSVTITGTNFTDATSVTIGGVAATDVVVVNSTTITATTPAGTAGAADVAVTTPVDTGTLTGGYTYDDVATVTAVSPNIGPTAGGATITITGTGFLSVTSASQVLFGSTAASNLNVISDTSLTVTSPAGVVSTVDVTVTNDTGTASSTSSADQYTFQLAPTISNINPASGPGGTAVVITGTNFTNVTSVTFNGIAAVVDVVNGTTINTTSPFTTFTGLVDVVITTPGGVYTVTNGYEYDYTPTVAAISPNVGGAAGGTTVTITGTHLTGVTGVKFGSVAGTIVSIASDTTMTVTSPAGTVGDTVHVTVTTDFGTSATSTMDQFSYIAAPTVTGLSESTGSVGDIITITGTNFIDVSAVKFGTVSATSYGVANSTTIYVQVPVGTDPSCAGVDVTVVTPAGTSATSGADVFTNTDCLAPSSLR